MIRLRPILTRLILYPTAFLLPPLLTALVLGTTLDRPKPIPAVELPKAAPIARDRRPVALFILGSQGTNLTELLGAYAVLGASNAFQLVTAAPRRELLPTSGNIGVIPDVALAQAPAPDVLVLPSLADARDPELIGWLRTHYGQARLVLCLGEAAKLAVYAGELRNRYATTSPLAFEELRRMAPRTRWEGGRRFVEDDELITSAGSTAALEAALRVVRRMRGQDAADEAAEALDYKPVPAERVSPRPGRWELTRLFVREVFEAAPLRLAVLAYPGVEELGLAATLDLYPRVGGVQVESLAIAGHRVVRTRHGLTMVAARDAGDLAAETSVERGERYDDLLIVPSGRNPEDSLRASATDNPLQEASVRDWIGRGNVIVKSFLFERPGAAWDRNLALLTALRGPGAANVGAQWLEYPAPSRERTHPRAPWTESPWLRPAALGLAFVSLMLAVDLLVTQRRRALLRGD